MIRPMSLDETRALLEASRVGHLGCVAQGTPYVVPVNYMLDGTTIYVHSFVGRKIRALRQNPRVCLQVEEIQDEYNWRSAIAFWSPPTSTVTAASTSSCPTPAAHRPAGRWNWMRRRSTPRSMATC